MSVIFSRAPLRVSLGGGGTDLPSYYREHGGFLVAGRDRQVRLHAHAHGVPATLPDEVRRRPRSSSDPSQIRHPILREALLRHWRGDPLEIASVADVPAGTGMGSSGAFAVCLLKALAQARSTSITPAALAEAASEIEIDVLEEPVGKQDTYVAAHGGICSYTFHSDGPVDVVPLELERRDAPPAAGQPLALLHRRGARRVRRAARPGRAHPHRRRRDARQPPRTKEMGFQSGICCSRETSSRTGS